MHGTDDSRPEEPRRTHYTLTPPGEYDEMTLRRVLAGASADTDVELGVVGLPAGGAVCQQDDVLGGGRAAAATSDEHVVVQPLEPGRHVRPSLIARTQTNYLRQDLAPRPESADKTRRDTTRRDATPRDRTRRDATRHDATRRDTTRHDATRRDATRRNATRHASLSRDRTVLFTAHQLN